MEIINIFRYSYYGDYIKWYLLKEFFLKFFKVFDFDYLVIFWNILNYYLYVLNNLYGELLGKYFFFNLVILFVEMDILFYNGNNIMFIK